MAGPLKKELFFADSLMIWELCLKTDPKILRVEFMLLQEEKIKAYRYKIINFFLNLIFKFLLVILLRKKLHF